MLELRPLDAEGDILRLRGFELGLRLRHGFVRADARLVEGLCQIERLFVSDNGSIQHLLQRVLSAKLEVIRGHVGLDDEAGILEVRRAGLRAVGSRSDGIPDAAEQVRLPGRVEGECIVGKRDGPEEETVPPDRRSISWRATAAW